MNIKRRIAVLLVWVMVLTAIMPNIIYGKSINRLAKSLIRVEEGHIFTDRTTANSLVITFGENGGGKEIFYLELIDARWSEEALNRMLGPGFNDSWYYVAQSGNMHIPPAYTYLTLENETTMRVEMTGVNTLGSYAFYLAAQITGEYAKVKVIGGDSTVTEGTYTFATVQKKAILCSVGKIPSFYTEGIAAPITISESYKGALEEGNILEFIIDDDNFGFNIKGEVIRGGEYYDPDYTTYKLDKEDYSLTYGYFNRDIPIYIQMKNNDTGWIKVIIPPISKGNSLGKIILDHLYIKSANKAPSTGKIYMSVSAEEGISGDLSLQIANIASYGAYIEMQNDKAVNIPAGHTGDITFTVGENVRDSILPGREFDLKLIDYGYFDARTLLMEYGYTGKTDEELEDMTLEELEKLSGELNVAIMKHRGLIEKTSLVKEISFATDGDKLDLSTLSIRVGELGEKEDLYKAKFKLPVYIPISNKELGSCWMAIEGRALEEAASTWAVAIVNPIIIKTTPTLLKVGLKSQEVASITILETDKSMLLPGTINLEVEGITGTTVDKDFETIITGKMGNTTSSLNAEGTEIQIQSNRVSKIATTITIDHLKFTTNRMVAEGTYDLKISGDGIDVYGDTLTIEDYLRVGTKNTEEIALTGLIKGSVQFVIGSKSYMANNSQKQMDVAAYIQDPGYTMIPVRYVVEGFGLGARDILFGQGTVTLLLEGRTIQLTANSNIAVVNGVKVEMAVPVVIKDGRTCAPVGEIAKLMGLRSSWASEIKTATFTNDK